MSNRYDYLYNKSFDMHFSSSVGQLVIYVPYLVISYIEKSKKTERWIDDYYH